LAVVVNETHKHVPGIILSTTSVFKSVAAHETLS
jgi:hypothetical protein